MIELSVIIPTHNRLVLLQRALASVLAQEGVDLECIVVNDGSTDGTAAWLEGLDDSRVRVRHLGGVGGASARNAGLDMAQGEFIAFLDDDDEWRPGKARRQIDVLRHRPEVCIASTRAIARPFSWVHWLGGKSGGVSTTDMETGNVLGSFSFCMARAAEVGALRLDPGLKACQDWDFWLKIMESSGGTGWIVPERLVIYSREDHARLSTSTGSKWRSTLRFARSHSNSLRPSSRCHLAAEISGMQSSETWSGTAARKGKRMRWLRILWTGTMSSRTLNPYFLRKHLMRLIRA